MCSPDSSANRPYIPVATTHGITFAKAPSPSRFQIVRLTPDAAPSVRALFSYSGAFQSPLWAPLYTPRNARLCAQLHLGRATAPAPSSESRKADVGQSGRTQEDRYNTPEAVYRRTLAHGLSYGVIDTEYVYKRPPGHPDRGSGVYWSELLDPSRGGRQHLDDYGDTAEDADALRQRLLEGMDFPLVSATLGLDLYLQKEESERRRKDLDGAEENVRSSWPLRQLFVTLSSGRDPRPVADWFPTEQGQVLGRQGTATHPQYEGMGLMTSISTYFALEMRRLGFKAMLQPAMSPAVEKVWMTKIPAIEVIAAEGDAEKVHPFKTTLLSDRLVREIKILPGTKRSEVRPWGQYLAPLDGRDDDDVLSGEDEDAYPFRRAELERVQLMWVEVVA